MKLCWLDVRPLAEAKAAVIQEALHHRFDAVLSDDPADLVPLPPTVRRVLFAARGDIHRQLDDVDLDAIDVVVVDPGRHGTTAALAQRYPAVRFGVFVEIVDAPSLELACQAARTEQWSVLRFRDPTKIPLEIVIAAAAGAEGSIITVAEDVMEAEIIYGVLEHGSDGVLLAPDAVGQAAALKAAAQDAPSELKLVELRVTSTSHVGMGERACVDTCTYLRQDEGILVGSHSKGMVLCVSETHPLPYMPTRPFRVNAGAIHSYTLGNDSRTNYLSELRAGSKVLAVDVQGQTRLVTVGRVKIESRPLLAIDAVAADGTEVNLIVQDDWHVRVLGPGGKVFNSTELEPGDILLGYLPTQDRHVGYAIDEFCVEQ
ncbi:3-dehydroquinate synthase II [Actinophytocola gossypii]|uniref:3-dehydroquinate synthase II n=1 Tax=Actinophytocola gossypii TaxID=2812003 RepID=A0ABT2J1R1_9PSEU|nr:3-dehydroquinate synthase II [Actinophytocola gossypii]MCT2581795.1 3-dehydroquinate synthase II [Actinophytocola gossypii]